MCRVPPEVDSLMKVPYAPVLRGTPPGVEKIVRRPST
jgi:hypothetical protein